MRNSVRIAFAAAALIVASRAASAQQSVVFGDSLSDTGNAFLASGGTNPNSPLGRYSNGLNWVDLLLGPSTTSTVLHSTNGSTLDFAFGGAYSGIGNIGNGTAPGTPGAAPGIAEEIALYQLLKPTGFAPNDKVFIWGGANNGFYFLNTTPPNQVSTLMPGAVNTAVASELAGINSLVQSGAKTIVVMNLPDLGITPAFNGNPLTALAGSTWTNLYNGALNNGLIPIAAASAGVNFVQADIQKLLGVVLANPSAFGLTNVTTPCGFKGGTACNGVLFGDSVHPTQAGYAGVAQYLALLLNTGPAIASTQPLGEIGQWATGLVSNAAFDRMSNWMTGVYAFKNGPYVEALGQVGSYDETIAGNTTQYHLNLGGARMGIDRAFGDALAGFSAAFLAGDQSSPGFSNEIMTVHGDAYGSVVFGPFYVSADAGVAHLWFDNIKRDTGFPTVTATGTTTGLVGHVGGEIGMMQRFGSVAIIPSGRVRYIYSSVAGYGEEAPILALQYADRTSSNVFASARVRAVTQMQIGAFPTSVFGEVGYEALVSSDNGSITGRLIDNTALPVIVNPGDPNGQGILGKVGLSAQLKDSLYLDMSYGITVHDAGGETHALDARLKAHF